MDVLAIPSVLGRVLKNTDTKSLADICRLVSRQWNDEACRILRSRITITFGKTEEIMNFTDIFVTSIHPVSLTFCSFRFSSDLFVSAIEDIAFGNLRRLQSAIKSFSDLMGAYVSKLEVSIHPIFPLEGNTVQKSTVIMFQELLRMIYEYFQHVKSLKLLLLISCIEIPDEFSPKTFLDGYKEEIIEELETIAIDIVNNQGYSSKNLNEDETNSQHDEMISSFLKQLIVSSPGVTRISSSNSPDEGSLLFHDLIINNFQLMSPYLRSIDTKLKLPEHSLQALTSQQHFYLSSLQLEIDTESVTPESFTLLFIRFKNSLSSLKLSFSSIHNSQTLYPRLPMAVKMNSLRRISLEKYGGCLDLHLLPRLESLRVRFCFLKGVFKSITDYYLHLHNPLISNCSISDSYQFKSERPPYSPLNTLDIGRGCQIDQGNAQVGIELVEVLPKCFSSLTTLKISYVNTVPLSVIFEECKSLQNLQILNCKESVTDEALCGIRVSLLRLVSPLGSLTRQIGSDDVEGLEKVQEVIKSAKTNSPNLKASAFIGNLKDLRSLTLEGVFSDNSVLFGVIHCERLRKLQLQSDFTTWRGLQIAKIALRDLVQVNVSV